MCSKTRVVVRAPAKVNLFFDITGTALNGYHLVDSVMQTISLCDHIVLQYISQPGIHVHCTQPEIPQGSDNLAYRAAEALLAKTGTELRGGLAIQIEKRIPQQAGLGGGSADAAAVLRGLNRMLAAPLSELQLQTLAFSLGADVPFLLSGGCARARGIGEQLDALAPAWPPQIRMLVAKPAEGVSTPSAFAAYDRCHLLQHTSIEPMLDAISYSDVMQIGRHMFNIFEQVIPNQSTACLRRTMQDTGALGSALSGSGSAVTALFNSQDAAEMCLQQLTPLCDKAFLVSPLDQGAEIISIN